MKNIFYILIGLLAFSCQSIRQTARQTGLQITPEKLNLFVDQHTDPYTLPLEYTLTIPAGFVSPRERLIYTTRLVAPGHELSFPSVIVQGKKYKPSPGSIPGGSNSRIITAQAKNMHIKISQRIPFQLWMPQARLVSETVLENTRHRLFSDTRALAGEVIYLPLGPGPALVKYVQKKVTRMQRQKVSFYYATNLALLQTDYAGNRDSLAVLEHLLGAISRDTSARPERILITGYTSPDGSETYNEKLARKRAQNLAAYLQRSYNLNDYRLELNTSPENWQELERLVEESGIPSKQKILEALRNLSPEARETGNLRRLPAYPYLRNKLFPLLQKATCKIYYSVTYTETVVEPL